MEIEIDIDEPAEDAPPREVPPGALATPGRVVGARFHIRSFIGRGLLGEIYRAIDAQDERSVALRLMPRSLFTEELLEQLRSYIQKAITLKHKNIASPYEMGEEEGFVFITSEYVNGQSVRALMARKGSVAKALSLKSATNVIAHVCNALSAAHPAVIHGVLSSANVLINKEGRVKLTDFGFIRIVPALAEFRQRLASGSLGFVAPEVTAAPSSVDARTDIFSVGALLYEILTGRPYVSGAPPPSQARSDIPKEVDTIVGRCVRQRPDERFQTALELKTALLAAVEGKPATIRQTVSQQGVPSPSMPQKRMPFGAGIAQETRPGSPGSGEGGQPVLGTIPGIGPQQVPTHPPIQTQPEGRPEKGVQPPNDLPPPPPPSEVVDENDERWLVQKDKLDFGPYSLAEVRRRIENAEFLGDHYIVDQHTGMRRRIRDLPALRDFVREGEIRREQMRREAADREHKKQERRRLFTMLLLVVVVLGLGGSTVGYVILYRQTPMTTTQIEIRDKGDGLDRDLQQLIAGLQISSSVEEGKRARRRHKRLASRAATQGPDVIDLGDVSKEGEDEQLSPDEINAVMRANFRSLAGCMLEARRRDPSLTKVVIDFDVHGDGNARNIRVNGSSSDPLATCVTNKMESFRFPRYIGPKTRARWDMRMQ